MAELKLYLIRHAYAGERGPDYPDDSKRPLDAKGKQQTKQLHRFLKAQNVTFDRLFSSPYTRAAETAKPLAGLLRDEGATEYLDSLTGNDYPQVLSDLQGRLEADDHLVGLVGHEPYLSELAAFLLTGTAQGVRLQLKKAAFLVLRGELEAGKLGLEALISASAYRKLNLEG